MIEKFQYLNACLELPQFRKFMKGVLISMSQMSLAVSNYENGEVRRVSETIRIGTCSLRSMRTIRRQLGVPILLRRCPKECSSYGRQGRHGVHGWILSPSPDPVKTWKWFQRVGKGTFSISRLRELKRWIGGSTGWVDNQTAWKAKSEPLGCFGHSESWGWMTPGDDIWRNGITTHTLSFLRGSQSRESHFPVTIAVTKQSKMSSSF